MIHRLFIVVVVVSIGCLTEGVAQPANVPAGVLAKAGDTYISEREFAERFELLPGLQRHRAARLEEAKLELLYSLIAEKLMAQEARERKLDQDSIFKASYEDVRKMLARDQLYRDEVSGKVRVSSKEIGVGAAQALKEVLISFLYCDRKSDAEFLRNQITTEKEFDRIQIDTSIHVVRDTATIVWSDATPAIEHAAYSMKRGEISPVIPAGTGFYIMKVERVRKNEFYAGLQVSVLRERVQSRIRERKEEQRLGEYVVAALGNKPGYARPEPLRELASSLKEAFAGARVTGKVSLSEAILKDVRRYCRSRLNDTLAVAGDVVWTVGQIIDRMYEKGFTVDSLTVRLIPQQVNGLLRVWVQQELLAQEALARGLDKYPAVQKQLETWYDNFLEQSMRFYLKRQAKVSDAEVLSFMQSSDSSLVIPTVQIRELRTASLDEMHGALNELQNGKSMEEVVGRWCSDSNLRQRKGITDPFPVSDRYPIGEIAWQMLVGQRYGPLKDGQGYLYFELMSKHSPPEPRDTAYVGKKQRATNELLRQKEKRLVNLFLAQAGESRGYAIFQDRLSAVKVSPIPMMTFRILGFGGRMFAVPFVDRQIEWLNVEPPKGKIVF